jgi:maltose O-acetyltransferase
VRFFPLVPVSSAIVSSKTEKEKMLAGDRYDATDAELVAERRAARALTDEYNATDADEPAGRSEVLADLFGSVGGAVTVEPPFRCDYGYNVHVGDGFYANYDCVFLDVRRVTFGRDCLVGPGVHAYTATHPLDATARTDGLESGDPVRVGDEVWVGGRAVLNPGVTVGDRSVVASGAVVIEDVPADVVVGGNPARVVRDLA